jgi:hypothetical protein
VLTFFIAGLLYLLCFEHVDNLGAYSIPSETGLLIPSDYVSRVASPAFQGCPCASFQGNNSAYLTANKSLIVSRTENTRSID